MAHRKNPAAVALGARGGKIGGLARAAKLTAKERSESARKAVLARWAKARNRSKALPDSSDAANKKAMHRCLRELKNAKDEKEIRRLTLELQKIVFHKQYLNAED